MAVRKTTTGGRAVRRPVAPARAPAGRAGASRYRTPAAAMRLAGVGDSAVRKATGREWGEWLRLLDRAGARRLAHKDIALMLSRKFGVPDWWSQMVTVGYEQARGLRAPNQKAEGFAANASRTVNVPLEGLYAAWSDAQLRQRWLLAAPVEVRRFRVGKSMRMTWTVGDSSVAVNFRDKGDGRSQVAVEHGRLSGPTAVKRQKAFWTVALERLKAMLESGR
jgi:hypothetical protein